MLPFILGLAIGAGAVIAYQNPDKLKENSKKLLEKAKDSSKELQEKAIVIKDKIQQKAEQILKKETKTTKSNTKKPKE